MNEIILKKEKGLVSVEETTTQELERIKGKEYTHLCWIDCENCGINCPKVADIKKKAIDKYDFITDGRQIIDENGNIDAFVVEKCQNYKKEVRIRTEEKLKELKTLRDGLWMTAFDASSLDEAYLTQYELEKKGLIKNIRGKRPREQQIEMIRRRMKK